MSISLKFLDHLGPTTSHDADMAKVVAKSDQALQRAAALAFASELVDCPAVGASPATTVNHAVATFFVHGRQIAPKQLKALGKSLKALTKMGVAWNTELIPLHLVKEMGLPAPALVENRLRVVGDLLTQVCEGRQPPHRVALRAEVWNGRSGRLKLVLNGHQEVGYCHRPGPKGGWTIYQDIGENSKKLADNVETKELLKVVRKLFGGDAPEKVVVEGPVTQAAGAAVKAVGGMAADAGALALNRFATRAAQRSAVARTAVDAARGHLSGQTQVRSKMAANGLKANNIYTVRRTTPTANTGTSAVEFLDDKGRVVTSLAAKDFQQRLKDKGLETVANTTPTLR